MLCELYDHSLIFIWALLAVYPYFFMQLINCHFMFFVLLVNENLDCMQKVLEKLHEMHQTLKINLLHLDFHVKSNIKPQQTQNCVEMFDMIFKLKRVFGILSDTTLLINEINGPPYMAQLIVLILGDISAGYKVYLSFMGEVQIERLGGKQ